MHKIKALCDRDREMMQEFSCLCIMRLNGHLPFKLFLSLFQHFLDANVLKEIEKDRLIMEQAASGFEKGQERTALNVDELFEITKKVDADFLNKLSTHALSIKVRYEDIAVVRKKRIAVLVNMVFDLLLNWHETLTFSDTVKNTFSENSYQSLLREVLHLYNVETRLLNNSITLHGPAGRVKDLFGDKLFDAMEKTACEIALTYTRKVYATPVATSGQSR